MVPFSQVFIGRHDPNVGADLAQQLIKQIEIFLAPLSVHFEQVDVVLRVGKHIWKFGLKREDTFRIGMLQILF